MSRIDTPTATNIVHDDYPGLASEPLSADQQACLNIAWLKVDDCFDSIEGGPWLREASKTQFQDMKAALLFPYALGTINLSNPTTHFDMSNFPYSDGSIVLSQSLVVQIILHLMRSYVEQPATEGSGNIVYLSRRDYLDRWASILELEKTELEGILRQWKRQFLNLGRTKGLVDTKQGRLVPTPMRTRYPRFGVR